MRKTWLRYLAIAAIILLPVVVSAIYRWLTDLPAEVTIATGPVGGRYRVIAENLAAELERTHGIRVGLRHTSGSLDNLRLLQRGRADFALYQSGTERILQGALESEHEEIACVANMYSEVVHFIVRRGAEIEKPQDLVGRSIAVGAENSGDRATSRLLLQHFHLDEAEVRAQPLDYQGIEAGFADGTLDAAFLTTGTRAPVLQRLLATGRCDMVEIPHAEALAARQMSVVPYTVPAGMYRSRPPVEPARDVQTVAMRAQLLTRREAPAALVEEVTRIATGERFLKQNGLTELFTGGVEFARHQPEFALHEATEAVYDPDLQPLLDPNFVEATEGMRSFVVSVLIAGYVTFRWLRKRQERRNEHRLDQYIRAMLDIERRQLQLDQTEGHSDLQQLQQLLDETTALRQEALCELSAHELNEDRAAASFLEMAHALSDKINAKITRQRFDKLLADLADTLQQSRTVGDEQPQAS